MKKIDLVKLVKEVDKEEMIEGGVHKIFALTCLYKFIEMQEAAINYTHSCKSDSEQLVCDDNELDCPYEFTSRCTMGRCGCKPKANSLFTTDKYKTSNNMKEKIDELMDRFDEGNMCIDDLHSELLDLYVGVKRLFDVNTVLHTKDGRKMGNAIIVGKDDKYNIIKTDYGNEYKFTDGEIEECFYIGYSDLTDEEKQYMRETIGDHKHSV